MEVFELKSGKVILVSGLIDLQDDIIETLGEDVYHYIKGLCSYKVMDEEEVDQVKALKEELDFYDTDICNLRDGLIEAKESVEKLSEKIKNVKRIDRDSLTNTLDNISRQIALNESY